MSRSTQPELDALIAEATVAGQITAVCTRGTATQRIPIRDLPLPTPPPEGAQWVEAYRRWAQGA